MFLLLGLVLLVFVPTPWNFIALLACLALFGGELLFWNSRVRGNRRSVGAETLVGRTATVAAACRPDGQVRLAGELWAARCAEGADPGESVVVTGRDDLRLHVERAGKAAGP
jgi:membrane protein implicated in regulation of membrane protease activity